jgi:type II secretory pathway component PulF
MINKRRRLAEELSEVADDMDKSIKNKTHELFFTKLIIPIVIFVCFVIGVVLAVI